MKNKEYFAKGRRGIIYTAELDGKRILVKERNPSSDVDTIENEAEVLQLMNTHGIGPAFISMKNGLLVREFVDGIDILEWVADASGEQIQRVLIEILRECRTMDILRINKLEMHHPQKHILIRNNKPMQIDFERAHRTEKPKNVTQFCQWISGKTWVPILTEKNIPIQRTTIMELARNYKNVYTDDSFETIIRLVEGA